MKDISVTDYLGPGVYLLYNYLPQFGAKIAEKGYIVYHCDDLSRLAQRLAEEKFDYLLVNGDISKLDDYRQILRLSARCSINKIAINAMVTTEQRTIYYEFIKLAYSFHYEKDAAFYSVNNHIDESLNTDHYIQILLKKNDELIINQCNLKKHAMSSSQKLIAKTLQFVRPGDSALIVSSFDTSVDKILLSETKASKVDIISPRNFVHFSEILEDYHFIIVDDCATEAIIEISPMLTRYLLPAGRCVFFKTNIAVLNLLNSLNFQLEVYYYYENGYLMGHTFQGERISLDPELCVFMKNPLENTDFAYRENIYGYETPPHHLLAFSRDYKNPWLIRGLVEFPFRNRSTYHLKQYSCQVINKYAPDSPDYAAALAVLGYQLLDDNTSYSDVLSKILLYCTTVANLPRCTPHQYRWYISLSTLAGLIYNKNNEKTKALIHFSRASNVSYAKFSPTIGTKTLQSIYLQAIIFISMKKYDYAEMVVDKGIKRGMGLLYQMPDELIGKLSEPFNFVMYIYHEIIDWIIKLINIKNAFSSKKFCIATRDNNTTWSALLDERMNAINSMSKLISDRDNEIYKQRKLIEKKEETIRKQKLYLSVDTPCNDKCSAFLSRQLSQKIKMSNILNEYDEGIYTQNLLMEHKEDAIFNREQSIPKSAKSINEVSKIIQRNDKCLLKLATKPGQAESELRSVYRIPIIGFLLRKLKMK